MIFVVLLKTGKDDEMPYGPFDDQELARRFAAFLSEQVDPATVQRLLSPERELLSWYANRHSVDARLVLPENWPPQPGQVWQDRNKDRWVCAGTNPSNTPYLVCIARQADDSAEEILRQHGPMTLVHSFQPTEEECPF